MIEKRTGAIMGKRLVRWILSFVAISGVAGCAPETSSLQPGPAIPLNQPASAATRISTAQPVLKSGEELIDQLKNNVLAISASFPSGLVQEGFGFVTGVRDGEVYIATANHTVRGDFEDAVSVQAAHHQHQGRVFNATLLSTHDSTIDLAVLTVRIPEKTALLFDVVSGEAAKRGQAVKFIGRSGTWFTPARPGLVNDVNEAQHEIIVEGLPVAVGTSGAPLISDDGIVGMIVRDNAELATATNIGIVRRQFDRWQHPWQLKGTSHVPPPHPPIGEDPDEPPVFDDRIYDPYKIAGMNTSTAYRTQARIAGKYDYGRVKFRKWRDVEDSSLALTYQGVRAEPILTRRASDAFDATSDLAVFELAGGFVLIQQSVIGGKYNWEFDTPSQSRSHYKFFNSKEAAKILDDNVWIGLYRADYDIVRLPGTNDFCLSFVVSNVGRRRTDGFFCKPSDFTEIEAAAFLREALG